MLLEGLECVSTTVIWHFGETLIDFTLAYLLSCWDLDENLPRKYDSKRRKNHSPPHTQSIRPEPLSDQMPSIYNDTDHPLNQHFTLLPSGWRSRTLKWSRAPFNKSFVSSAITALNSLPRWHCCELHDKCTHGVLCTGYTYMLLCVCVSVFWLWKQPSFGTINTNLGSRHESGINPLT